MNSETLLVMSVRVAARAEQAQRVAARAEMVARVAAKAEMAFRIAARREIRLAVFQVCAEVFPGKTASNLPTHAILVAMAETALVPPDGPVRIAGLGNLVSKLKQMADAIKANPNLWDHLKKLIGIDSLDQLPGKMKELVREGYQGLRKAVEHAFKVWPLKVYTYPEAKLISVNALIEKLVKMSPNFSKFLRDHVKPHIDQFDQWLRKTLPHVSKALMIGIYVWIWMNVVEFEWHLKDLVDVATGVISLADLLLSLPASAIGFLMNALNVGIVIPLLPIAFVVRLLVVHAARYIEFEGGSIKFNREKFKKDFHATDDQLDEVT